MFGGKQLFSPVPGIIIVRHTSLTEEECVWLYIIKSLAALKASDTILHHAFLLAR